MGRKKKDNPKALDVGQPGKTGHPLLRVLFAAPTNYTGRLVPQAYRFLHAVGRMHGARHLHGIPGTNPNDLIQGTGEFRSWIEQTPIVSRWVRSERFLTAPNSWPDSVQAAFGWAVPTPYETSFWLARKSDGTVRFHDCILYAYCSGLSLVDLSATLGLTPDEITLRMVQAVQEKMSDVRFVLWSWGLDWSKVTIPPEVDESILTRLGIKNKLMDGSYLSVRQRSAEYNRLRGVRASPRFERYAMVAPKTPMRLIPPDWWDRRIIRHGLG